MGRTIVADERVQKCIENLQSKEEWIVGLLIGQITEQKDYVVHIVKTPESDSDGAKPKKGGLDSVDDGWVTTHARQVLRMLPGGLDIIGVFAMATQDAMKNAQLQLRKVLFSVQKMVSRMEAASPDVYSDRAIVSICSLTKKVTCRTFDTADIKSAARPAEWKVQSVLNGWVAVESSLTTSHTIPVSVPALSQTLNKQIQVGLSPLVDSIRTGLATVNGELRPPGEPLDNTAPTPTQHGKKSKKGQAQQENKREKVTVQLLLNLPGSPPVSDVTLTPCGAQMRLQGTMACKAFVHAKGTVSEAIQAVKRDVVRSLLARCDLLCEDLLQAEEEQDPRVLYETPVRIYGSVAGTPLCFSDYMFQDETPADSIDRFKELLNLEITEDDLEMDVEHVPTESDVSVAEDTQSDTSDDANNATTKVTAYNIISMMAGGVVAMLAAGISYLYLGDQ